MGYLPRNHSEGLIYGNSGSHHHGGVELRLSWLDADPPLAPLVATQSLNARRAPHKKESLVAKKAKKKAKAKKTAARRGYTKDDLKLLKTHSKSKTPVERIAKLMKRSGATLRQKARAMGLPLGHRR